MEAESAAPGSMARNALPFLRRMTPGNMSMADHGTLNDVLFGDQDGPKDRAGWKSDTPPTKQAALKEKIQAKRAENVTGDKPATGDKPVSPPKAYGSENKLVTAERAEDERDGRVGGEHRADHADRDEQGAHQPVAEVGGEHQAGVGVAEVGEHDDVDQAEEEADGVDPEGAEELADHDLAVAHRQGEQQLIRARAALVGPQAHGDGRDEEHQDGGHPAVEGGEVGEVAAEEAVREERRRRRGDAGADGVLRHRRQPWAFGRLGGAGSQHA